MIFTFVGFDLSSLLLYHYLLTSAYFSLWLRLFYRFLLYYALLLFSGSSCFSDLLLLSIFSAEIFYLNAFVLFSFAPWHSFFFCCTCRTYLPYFAFVLYFFLFFSNISFSLIHGNYRWFYVSILFLSFSLLCFFFRGYVSFLLSLLYSFIAFCSFFLFYLYTMLPLIIISLLDLSSRLLDYSYLYVLLSSVSALLYLAYIQY